MSLKVVSFVVLLVISCVFASDSLVRLAHASPNSPGFDVYIDNHLVLHNLLFSNVTKYANVPSGSYSVKVNLVNTQTTVLATQISLEGHQAFTFAAVNVAANLTSLTINDTTGPPPQGFSYIRFVHLSPNTPALDVSVVSGQTLFSNVIYKQSAHYVQLSPGTYNLQAVLHGSTTVVLTVTGVILTAGTVHSLIAEGLMNSTPPLLAVRTIDL